MTPFSDAKNPNAVTGLPIAEELSRIDNLRFDNRFVRELPADLEPRNYVRQVRQGCYSRVMPTPVPAPRLLAHSREVASLLGFSPSAIEHPQFAQVMAGNRLMAGMDPFAMCYGGHQFGNWAGQLGDGRAINLGELVNADGEHWTLQLKGAGATPYSRNADGLAVLRSSVREFLCSEAMHHLGVPTTRALCLVETGQAVLRDMFYDGNPEREPGAVVCRVSPSFVRFGNFEIFASRGETEVLRKLVDFTLKHDFPELGAPGKEAYVEMFAEICRRTARLIVHWMRVGFVHGVMNTDNMSILGLTIDYGPYGWLEDFDPAWTPNTTDAMGRRYSYGNQPQIAGWNLVQLANALMPLVEDAPVLQQALDQYGQTFQATWRTTMAAKLGLREYEPETDDALVEDLFDVLQVGETDMTLFYRGLADISLDEPSKQDAAPESLSFDAIPRALQSAYYRPDQMNDSAVSSVTGWLTRYRERLQRDGMPTEHRRTKMNSVNPIYVLRNYLAQLAIDRATSGDPTMIHELLDVLRSPYTVQPGRESYAEKRPDWARNRPGCSMLSCSS